MNKTTRNFLIMYGIGVAIALFFLIIRKIFFTIPTQLDQIELVRTLTKTSFLFFYFFLVIITPAIVILITKESNFKKIIISILLFLIVSTLIAFIITNSFNYYILKTENFNKNIGNAQDFLNILGPSPLSITQYAFCYDWLEEMTGPLGGNIQESCFFADNSTILFIFFIVKSFILALIIMLISSYIILLIKKKGIKR